MKAIITNESKDNNPSPLEALETTIRIENGREFISADSSNRAEKRLNTIKQALTNYNKQTEKYKRALKYLCDNMDCPIELLKDDSFCEDNCGWKPNHSPCWDRYFEQDITKVLEGKINE
jgi:hypothetical protein